MIARVIESSRRRHRRAHERHRHAHLRRGTHPAEGDQRHRHDAAAGGLPEVAHRAAPRREVLGGRLRLHPARPRDVHRGHGRQAHARPAGFGKDSIEVEGYVRGFARRRPDTEILTLRFANIVGPRIRTSITDYFNLPRHPRAARLRRPHAVHARGRRHRRPRPRHDRRRHRGRQPRGRRRGHRAPGGGDRRAPGAADAAAGRGLRRRVRAPDRAWPTSRPTRCRSSRSAAASTPPGCARCSGSSRGSPRAVPSRTSRAPSARPCPPPRSSGDAVSGVAGTASQVVLRTLGTGRGR